MHQSSLDKMRLFRDTFLATREQEPLTIVDLGSLDVNGTYRPLFRDPAWRYIGADLSSGPNVDLVLACPYRWPELTTASVDIVVSGQAFEHMEFFWITMLEISRILIPGGLCCIVAPAAGPEHRYPVDCWRFYSDGLAALARFARFEVLSCSTQWETQGYPDGSDIWHDTQLICRKPEWTPWQSLTGRIRRFLQHRALTIGL